MDIYAGQCQGWIRASQLIITTWRGINCRIAVTIEGVENAYLLRNVLSDQVVIMIIAWFCSDATLVYRPSCNVSGGCHSQKRGSRPRHCSRADIPAWHPKKPHYCINDSLRHWLNIQTLADNILKWKFSKCFWYFNLLFYFCSNWSNLQYVIDSGNGLVPNRRYVMFGLIITHFIYVHVSPV